MSITLDEKHKLIDRSVDQNKNKADILKKVNLTSKQALAAMAKEKVIATPANYKSYFENQLEKCEPKEQKELQALIASEEEDESAYIATLEKEIHSAYLHIKKMAEIIAASYVKINETKKLTADVIKNPSPAQLNAYQEKLTKTVALLNKELKQTKENYRKTAEIISTFSKNTMFDKKYDVYNKQYLLKTLESIIKNAELFDYANTLLAVRIKPDIFSHIKLNRDKEMLNRTLAKLLYKRSRRSDIIAHYEDGIFMIVLKHTDVKLANITIERIKDMLESANFMIDGNEIEIALDFALRPIDKEDIKELIITETIDSLQ